MLNLVRKMNKKINKILFVIIIFLIGIKFFVEYFELKIPVKKHEIEIGFVEPRKALIENLTMEKKRGNALFEQSHQLSHSIYADLSRFASFFGEAGFKIKAADEELGDLSNVDILVIVSPTKEYNETEREKILSMLRIGGTLIVLGERTSSEILNRISLDFGMIFNKDKVYDLYNYSVIAQNPIVSEFYKSRISQNVSEIVLYDACSINTFGSAVGLAFTSETGKSTLGYEGRIPVAAISTYGSGKIFAICDTDLFTNKNMKKFDNEIFVKNLISWS